MDMVEIAIGFGRWDFVDEGFRREDLVCKIPNVSHLGFLLARNSRDKFWACILLETKSHQPNSMAVSTKFHGSFDQIHDHLANV